MWTKKKLSITCLALMFVTMMNHIWDESVYVWEIDLLEAVGIRRSMARQPPKKQREQPFQFVMFVGGKSANADMNAILDTWGSKVQNALIMTNTPQNLPMDRIDGHNGNINNLGFMPSWRVHETQTLSGGPTRTALRFWKETFKLMNEELQRNQNIQWIVRSDSDTWWNVDHLASILSHEKVMPAEDPAMMGQFYGLKNGKWEASLAHPFSASSSTFQDNGKNAYLTGRSGVVFSRAAIETFDSCLKDSSFVAGGGCKSGNEDVWLSCLAYQCKVSLVRNEYMFQRPDQPDNSIPMSKIIAIHRAVGDGRGAEYGWKHPSFYEKQLL